VTFRTVLSIGIAAAAVVLFVFDPATSALFPSCPLRVWTGLLCPGCGTLRAMHALLHGHIGAAMHDNALATAALIAIGAAWLRDLSRPLETPWMATLTRAGFGGAGVGLALGFGVLRNIPMTPFSWFTP
jgi:Protein of unknown function (DUF2752)